MSRGRRPEQSDRDAIRCFVALQPDGDAREALDRLAGEQHARWPAARRMRRENLHLTLAFIGRLDRRVAGQVAARLAAESVAPFDWTLDAVGIFAGARVLWVGGDDARLDALATHCRRLLDELAVRFDRKPFVAHVTLLRNVPRDASRAIAPRLDAPIQWCAGPPVLLQSIAEATGTRYAPLTPSAGEH